MPEIVVERNGRQCEVSLDPYTSYEDWQVFCHQLEKKVHRFPDGPLIIDCSAMDDLPSIAYAAIFTVAIQTHQNGGKCLIHGASDRLRRTMARVGLNHFIRFTELDPDPDHNADEIPALEPKQEALMVRPS